MAFLNYDEKQNKDEQNQPQMLGASGDGGGVAGAGGSNVLATNTGMAGRGGQNAFTNIQSYLTANAGNEASKQLLEGTVGKQIEESQKNLAEQAGKAKQQVSQAQQSMVGKDEASKLVSQYAGQQGQAYDEAKNRVKGFLNYQDQLPQFNYAMPGQLQDYKTGLEQGGDAFSSMMNKVYGQAVQSPLTSGVSALQNQFDTSNLGLQQAREGLKSKYSALEKEALGEEGLAAKTAKEVQDVNKLLPKQKEELKQYLAEERNKQTTGLEQRASDINELGRQTYNSLLGTRLKDVYGNLWGEDIAANPTMATFENVAGGQGMRDRYNVIADWLGQSQLAKPQNEIGLEDYTFQSKDVGGNRDFYNQYGGFMPLQQLAQRAGKNANEAISAQDLLDLMASGKSQGEQFMFKGWNDPELLKRAQALGYGFPRGTPKKDLGEII